MNKALTRLLACLTGVSVGNGGSACGDSTLQSLRHTAIFVALFNWFCVITTNKFVHFLARFITAPALLLLLSVQAATAADYYWIIYNLSHTVIDVRHASASAACDYTLEYLRSHTPDRTYRIREIHPSHEYQFACYIQVRYPDTDVFVNMPIPTVIYRQGGSCPAGKENNKTTGECANDQQKSSCNSCPCADVHDPINAAVGNSFQTEVDYPSGNLSTLHFTRVYNSLDGLWRHNHSTYLRLTSFAIALVMADGRESFFTFDGSTVTASPTELGRLTKTADTWLYTAKNNDTYSFDATGRLTRWSNAAGTTHLLSYVNGSVTVTDNLGQSLSFTEDAQHQPLTLSTAGVSIQYDYNANQRLSKLTRTRGGQTEQRQFHYEIANKPNLLTGITDERGVRFTTWTFDDQDRATSSEHAGGVEHGDVAYNADGSSTVTNEFGKKSIYRFVTIDGVKRVSAIEGEALGSCPMSNSTFTYDTRGLLKTKTDNKGFVTIYDYNTRGLESTRTEAAGTPQARTTTSTWHATLNLPLTVTEPGRVITYTYDTQGRQLSQASASTAF
jgi:YD repeat-containing protein